MVEAQGMKFNNEIFEIVDAKARAQLNNIANELGVDENGEAIELETTAQDIRPAINEVFQSVSNGKKIVAKAITDKGVDTLATDTFQTMANNISAIQGSSGTVTTDIQNTLNKCGAKKMRFGVLSDIHLNTDTSHAYNVKFANALTKLKELGCNFIVITGDLCNYDKENELNTYASMINGYTLPIYEIAGNHDCGSGGVMLDTILWKNITGQDAYYEIVQDDEVFLFLSQKCWEDVNSSNHMLLDEDKDWLLSKLEQYKTKSRVFLFHHQYMDNCEGFAYRNGNTSNSYIKQDTEWWKNIASTYKNVIWFSGHSHTDFSYQADFPNVLAYNKNGEYCTMIHVPSLTYGDYYVVDVYEHLIEIEGYRDGEVYDTVYFAIDDYIYVSPIESVVLDKSTLNFANTDTQTLVATVTPTSQQDLLVWETSNSNIATVVGGIVTPVANGDCVITARCGDKSATCTVTVDIAESELYYSINSVLNGCTLSNTATSIKANETYVATITEGSNMTIKSVVVKMGGTDITSTAYNSSNKTIGIDIVTGNIEITITVNKLATGISLNQTSISATSTGQTIQLTATLTPSDAVGTVTWETSDSNVATVVNGLVTITATSSSTCTITATCNGHSATCNVSTSIVSKTVIYSLDSVTRTIPTSGTVNILDTANFTLPTVLEKGKKYYMKAESFKDSNGNDINMATNKIYIVGEAYNGSTQVSSKLLKDYADIVTEAKMMQLPTTASITTNSSIDSIHNFQFKRSSSSNISLPVTVTLKGLEIYTLGESN